MSAGEYFQIFSQLGKGYFDQQEKDEQKSALAKLGQQVQGGDYAAAAQTAFGAGDVQTGIGLLKLGQTQEQQKTASAGIAGLTSMYGGGGGFDAGGPVAASGANRNPYAGVPSFLDSSGPSGNYLSGLFKRESGNNPNAQASTSGARGLGQFIPSTWNATAQQHPELALTPVGNGQDGRTDPQQMIAATKALTADNEGILGRHGLPVNDATRYAMHFLGAGGGPRLIAGTLQNPDAPAASYADPKAVAANRPVFFNRDGSPKTAGQVMNDFGRSFAGGGRGVPQAAAPQVASADPTFAPSMPGPLNRPLAPVQGMNPDRVQATASGSMPSMVGQPAPAEIGVEGNILASPMRTAGLPQTAVPPPRPPQALIPQSMAGSGIPGTVMDRGVPVAQAGSGDEADMPAANAQPAQFQIPSGPQASLPAAPSSPQPRGPTAPSAMAPSSSPGALNFPQGAPPPRVMTMPGQDGAGASPEARAQLSAQAPQHLAQAGLPPQIAAPIGQMAPASQQRIGALVRVATLPGLSEGQAGVVKTLLANELEQTKLPDDVKQYMFARSQGFAGSLVDYKNELRKPLTPTIVAPGNAAIAPGERSPFYINPRAPTAVSAGSTLFDTSTNQPIYTAPAADRPDEGAKLRAQMDARREAAPGLGLQEGTPAYRSFVGAGKIGADRDMSAGDKKAIDTADNAVLSAQASIGMLEQAKDLSAKAYAGPLASERGRAMSLVPGNEAGQATLELDNLVTTNALTNLKGIFGGNPTEGERKILLDVAGSSNLPHALRVKVYQRAIDAATLRQQQNEARAAQIREGIYYRPGSGPAAAQGASAGGQSGAPALPPPSPSNRPGAVSPADRFGQLIGSGMTKAQAYQQLHSEGY